jgi:hypothetical protein
LKLNLLDVVVEVQRDQRLYSSGPEQLSLKDFRRLARPSPHHTGICVVHICLDYSRRRENLALGVSDDSRTLRGANPHMQRRKES